MFAAISKEIRSRGEYRFGRHGSFWHRFAVAPWRWAVGVLNFGDDGGWVLHLFCLWVRLWPARREPKDEMLDRWGVSFDPGERYLALNWGHRHKHIYMPWMYDHCRTEVMVRDGRFVPYERFRRGSFGESPELAGRYRESFTYRYTLRRGEVQIRTATVTVERRSWCWRAWPFRWFRWPSKTRTSIEVEFSDEVGEETGSWKGGCVGCGYDLRPNETPEKCLRRMEEERRF